MLRSSLIQFRLPVYDVIYFPSSNLNPGRPLRVRPRPSFISRASNESNYDNPLEQLRFERDPKLRANLMSSLDSKWSACAESYRPTEIESLLASELGVDIQAVLLVAVSTSVPGPPLCTYDVASAKASIQALKDANVDVADIWFLVSKRPQLLLLKEVLQRWLDFLTVYGLKDKDLVNFLLRSRPSFMEECTIYQAGQVVAYLKQLGIKNDFLAKRVFAVWPDILSKDVDADLRPITGFLMQMGMEVTDLSAMVCVWPELLLCKVDTQLAPFVAYLEGIGCSKTQLAEMLMLCPHLLGFQPDELFGHRLRSLESVGVGPEDVRSMVGRSLVFLTAPGGVQPQLDFLQNAMRLTPAEARDVIMSAPEVLAEKDFDLDRKWRFIQDSMKAGKAEVLACPRVMAANLMQVLGPRFTFLQSKGVAHVLFPWLQPELPQRQPESPPLQQQPKGSGAAATDPAPSESSDAGPGGPGGSESQWLLLLTALVSQEDKDWCRGLGLPYAEFREHASHFQTDFTVQVTQDAAKEFQDELKKLGIFEGSDS